MAYEKSHEWSKSEDDWELLENFLNDKAKFKKLIFQLLGSQHDPYQYLLHLLPLAQQKNKKRRLLLSEILSSFLAWMKESIENLASPSARYRTAALQLAMNSRDFDVLERVSRVFRINGLNNLDVIEENRKKGNIVMVAHAVKLYNLHDNYDFEKLYFPLLCFNMKKELKNCLRQSKDLKLQFVDELDKLIQRKKTLDVAIKSVQIKFSKRKSIKKDMHFYNKAMEEFIKEWNIPLERCVNFMRNKKCVAMHYLVSRYKKKETSVLALAELAVVITGKDKDLHSVMIRKLKFDPIASEAVMFKLENPLQCWPSKCDVVDFSSEFLNLNLDASSIIFVKDRVTYERSVRDISKCKEIGFDTEWQPTFGWSKEKIALLQIATWNHVYLFDVLSLSKCLSNNWTSLVKKVLHNTDILKVGYGTETDIEIFKEEFVCDNKDIVAETFENFLDLRNFYLWVSKLHPEIVQNLVSANDNTKHCDNGDHSPKSYDKNSVDAAKSSDQNSGGGAAKSSNQNSGDAAKSSSQNSGDGVKSSNQNGGNAAKSSIQNGGNAAKSSNQNGGDAAESSGKENAKKKKTKKKFKNRGLSGLCLLVLGKPLNKSEQISDWELRPLRKAQMQYAALDAFCLLQILERLEYVLGRMGLHKLDMIEKFFKEPIVEKGRKKSKAGESKMTKEERKKKTSNASASSASSSRVV